MTVGRKAGRASKPKPGPHPSSKSGSATAYPRFLVAFDESSIQFWQAITCDLRSYIKRSFSGERGKRKKSARTSFCSSKRHLGSKLLLALGRGEKSVTGVVSVQEKPTLLQIYSISSITGSRDSGIVCTANLTS